MLMLVLLILYSNYKMKEKGCGDTNDTTRKTQRKEKKKGVRWHII